MKARGVCGTALYIHFSLGTDWVWVVQATPPPFSSKVKASLTMTQEAG